MGPADGGRRRSLRADHPRTRHPYTRRSFQTSPAWNARCRPESREVAIFAAASETFSRRNINQSIDESLATYKQVCDRAAGSSACGSEDTSRRRSGALTKGDVALRTPPTSRARLIELGVFEVAVSDTIGIAHPGQVARVLDAVFARIPVERVALHFHDTSGTALANVLAALSYGISTFDASAGGLGGCPYAPGAAGNLATDDLVYMLTGWVSKQACR